jgi:hypothetical protein
MQQLADRFMNDENFREEMRRDPEWAAERSGLALDEEDKQALRSIDWNGSDEELKQRVSKSYRSYCWGSGERTGGRKPIKRGTDRSAPVLLRAGKIGVAWCEHEPVFSYSVDKWGRGRLGEDRGGRDRTGGSGPPPK